MIEPNAHTRMHTRTKRGILVAVVLCVQIVLDSFKCTSFPSLLLPFQIHSQSKNQKLRNQKKNWIGFWSYYDHLGIIGLIVVAVLTWKWKRKNNKINTNQITLSSNIGKWRKILSIWVAQTMQRKDKEMLSVENGLMLCNCERNFKNNFHLSIRKFSFSVPQKISNWFFQMQLKSGVFRFYFFLHASLCKISNDNIQNIN